MPPDVEIVFFNLLNTNYCVLSQITEHIIRLNNWICWYNETEKNVGQHVGLSSVCECGCEYAEFFLSAPKIESEKHVVTRWSRFHVCVCVCNTTGGTFRLSPSKDHLAYDLTQTPASTQSCLNTNMPTKMYTYSECQEEIRARFGHLFTWITK